MVKEGEQANVARQRYQFMLAFSRNSKRTSLFKRNMQLQVHVDGLLRTGMKVIPNRL